MASFRRALGRYVVAWLVCQAAALTCAPAALWVNVSAAADECTCVHGDHAICPMHHQTAGGPKVCLLSSPDSTSTATLGGLLGVTGILTISSSPMAPALEHRVVSADVATASLRPAPPDPPPPRV